MICNSCPRKCNIDRENSLGYCSSPVDFKVARAALHLWEEPFISGGKGSGTVFFSGCNLKCVYCQNYEISRNNKGLVISEDKLIEIFEKLIEKGANNINLVNPTHYVDKLASVLSRWKSPVPIVYNSSGYEDVDSLRKLEGLIDIYLPDFKYSRNEKSLLYSGASNYPDVVKDAIKEMKRQVNDYEFEGNLMKRGVVIRHLIIPGNTNSSLEILDYLSQDYIESYISIMGQYTPCTNLEKHPEINRIITKREYNKVVDYAMAKGFENVFIQDLDSASTKYIPSFDFEGIL